MQRVDAGAAGRTDCHDAHAVRRVGLAAIGVAVAVRRSARRPAAARRRRAGARVRLCRGDRGARRARSRRPRRRAGGRGRATAWPPATLIARLDTADAELAIRRRPKPSAIRPTAQLRLLQAGARAEDIRQARGAGRLGAGRRAGRRGRARRPPPPTSQRFEALLAANAGSRKQRDDAATRRDVATRAGHGGARARARRRRGAWRGCAPARGREEIAARARAGRVGRRADRRAREEHRRRRS